jgi:hypothetical protein
MLRLLALTFVRRKIRQLWLSSYLCSAMFIKPVGRDFAAAPVERRFPRD